MYDSITLFVSLIEIFIFNIKIDLFKYIPRHKEKFDPSIYFDTKKFGKIYIYSIFMVHCKV